MFGSSKSERGQWWLPLQAHTPGGSWPALGKWEPTGLQAEVLKAWDPAAPDAP